MPFPTSERPGADVGRAELFRAGVVDGVRSLARLATRGRHRDRAHVMAEYDAGYWWDIRSRAAWRDADDLEDFLVGRTTEPRLCLVDGQVVRVPEREYYRWRIGTIQRLVAENADGATTLVELGCGIGTNLLSLALSERWTGLHGRDISPNAIAAGQEIAEHFGLPHVTFGTIDLAHPEDPGFAAVRDQVVLTYFCLEQLPLDVSGVIAALAAAAPRRVIHIESAVGLTDRRHPLDLLNELYVRSRDYQFDLAAVLDAHAAGRRLQVLERKRLGFGSTIHNEAALFVWEPTVPSR